MALKSASLRPKAVMLITYTDGVFATAESFLEEEEEDEFY